MTCKSVAVAFAPLLLCIVVFAQAPQMPQPAPELKKLDYFVGTWKTDADMKPSSYGPGGKVTGTDRIQWMEGNFFVVIHTQFQGATGTGVELAVMGYDPARKVYTFSSYNSAGEHETATGSVEGDTWSWNSDQTTSAGGMRWRYTQKMLSPTTYAIKFEMTLNGSTWSTAMEGKATKQ